jgi:hypothetical protein
MPGQWRIDFWPACIAHVFLSHCAEDRQRLVIPIFEELERRGVVPWIDRHHYPVAREALEVLREELLRCRHVVYFITPAFLRQGRGWSSVERAFSAVIQQGLRYGEEVAHVELPLLFVPANEPRFQRSVWRSLLDKAAVCPIRLSPPWHGIALPFLDTGDRSWRDEHIEWAVRAIEGFVRQEEQWAIELGIRFGQDTRLNAAFSDDANLRRRVLAQSPRPLAAP